MPGLIIDDNLVTTLITEVAPLVSRVTGWDLNLPPCTAACWHRCPRLPKKAALMVCSTAWRAYNE